MSISRNKQKNEELFCKRYIFNFFTSLVLPNFSFVYYCIVCLQDKGPHIYQTCPSANFYDCKAMAIGSRSQSARTYLEKNLDKFPSCDTEELLKHGLRALRDTLPNEIDLNTKVNFSDGCFFCDSSFVVAFHNLLVLSSKA